MGYYLTVISGADKGKSCAVAEEKVLIGRSPSAALALSDNAVSWEHAAIEQVGGRLFVTNLSALGTKVRGKRITQPVRLTADDEIELAEGCTLLVVQDEEDQASRGVASPLVLALSAVLIVLIIAAGVFAVVTLTKPRTPPVTMRHWRAAYVKLDERLEQWHSQRLVPAKVPALYREGWRLEQVSNNARAASRWAELNSILLTLRVPEITGDNLTVAESTSNTPRALNIVMGWDQRTPPTAYEWNTDDAYADALVWFVRRRAAIARRAAELELAAQKNQKGKR